MGPGNSKTPSKLMKVKLLLLVFSLRTELAHDVAQRHTRMNVIFEKASVHYLVTRSGSSARREPHFRMCKSADHYRKDGKFHR